MNLLSQQADILTKKQHDNLLSGRIDDKEEYIRKGYLVEPAAEALQFRNKYLEFLDKRDTDEIQIFYVPTYQCNFNCPYCYQDEYQQENEAFNPVVAESFFRYIEKNFYGRRKYITIFGGEPLLMNRHQQEFMAFFLEQADEQDLDVAIVTNGYHLEEYIPLLEKASIREVQVTLDGVGAVHDKRRPLRGGAPTFTRIVRGIDAALQAGLPVNLRMVLDKENIHQLPELAKFAIQKKWTGNPLFKTQLGRNYELHHCQLNADRLYTRLGLYEEIYEMIKEHPEIMEFHKPAFSVARFLFEEGELPDPLFDSCPGTKTEWAFDYTGKIYSCTATVGKEGEELGSFFPEVKLDDEKIEEWEIRDVLAIDSCKSCNLRLACGGGCAAVAKNQKGSILAPDCRPIKELLELGIANYFRNELN